MNELDFYHQFLKYKDIIIDEIVAEFGEKYEDVIRKRISGYKFFFDSDPDENNIYMNNPNNNLNINNKISIKLKYLQFQTIKKYARKEALKYLKDFITMYFPSISTKKLNGVDNDIIISLFIDDNFNESIIDSLSTENASLLASSDTPNTIKENLIDDKKMLISTLKDFNISFDVYDKTLQDRVDKFITSRKQCRELYLRIVLTSDIDYVKKMSDVLGTKEYQSLYYISYYKYTHNGRIQIEDKKVKYIFYPIIREKNNGLKTADVNLVHEMIHCVQSKYMNDIIDEIDVQRRAIIITNRLHEKGIFIFDNPKNYVVSGEALYEILFPLAKDFIERYDDIFKDALINSSYSKLTLFFGDSWNKYVEEMKKTFEKICNYAIHNNHHQFEYKLNYDKVNNLINEMDEYYQSNIESRGKRHV